LVNGVLGTVEGFYQQEGANIDKDIPTILIAFDSYDRPLLKHFEGRICTVPITPSKKEFVINNVACTRTQVLLAVA
jgi:hypothetical protein